MQMNQFYMAVVLLVCHILLIIKHYKLDKIIEVIFSLSHANETYVLQLHVSCLMADVVMFLLN